jgi:hypothetical protein
MDAWTIAETNTHQDHVIAHVVGAKVEGYFIWDETAYLLLDIGFIWNIYLDGEMGLVPHPVAIAELDAEETVKSELRADIDLIMRGVEGPVLHKMMISPVTSVILSVELSARENSRRLLLTCEDRALVVETSLETAEVTIHEV